jgi:hypothetical protein
VSDTLPPTDDSLYPDDELLDLGQLLAHGLASADAQAVLGQHTALPRWEVRERYELLVRERGGTAMTTATPHLTTEEAGAVQLLARSWPGTRGLVGPE